MCVHVDECVQYIYPVARADQGEVDATIRSIRRGTRHIRNWHNDSMGKRLGAHH